MAVHTTSTNPPSADRATSEEIARALSVVIRRNDRVVVFGGYGCRNLGDEAILSVLLNDLRALGVRAQVVTADPAETMRLHEVEAVSASPGPVARAMLGTDAVLIGGGGIFSSYMGDRSRLLPRVATFAKLLRKKLIFRAIGVYQATPAAVARALVRSMERADFVSVRDDASVEALRGFGLRRQLYREDDPAMRLTEAPLQDGRSRGQIGFAVRRLRDAGEHGRMRRCTLEVANRIIASGRTPYFLPFSAHTSEPCEQDDVYSRELIAETTCPSACRIADPSTTPAQMLGLVASLDAVIAMRFHSIVFAAASSTPMVALPYDDKCSAFLEEHGLEGHDIGSVTANALTLALDEATCRVAA